GGSTYGYSTIESEPAFQRSMQNTGWRSVPDVVYNAGTPVYTYWTQPSTGVQYVSGATGTSAGAPQWAGLIAIADQVRAQNGLPTVDGASQTLPMLYNLPGSAFHAISGGSFSTTGLGSPVVTQVVNGLAPVANGGPPRYQLDSQGNLWKYTAA